MITLPARVKGIKMNDFTGRIEEERRKELHENKTDESAVEQRTRKSSYNETLYRKELERAVRIFVNNVFLSEEDRCLHTQKIPIGRADWEFLIERIKCKFKDF